MENPFAENDRINDQKLVQEAINGNKKSLETIIKKHQIWIFNIAFRMTGNHHDAEDITQEIIIKIITRLHSYKGKGSFRSWVYIIVKNHVLNMKKRQTEKHYISFSHYAKEIDDSPDFEIPDPNSLPVDLPVILEELRLVCLAGILLCLNREQRLVFILGEMFGIPHTICSEIFETTNVNFRKKLSRARIRVYNFMKNRCGLIDRKNSCHCRNKLSGLLKEKTIDPDNLVFQNHYQLKIKEISQKKYPKFNEEYKNFCRELYQNYPLNECADYTAIINQLIDKGSFGDVLNF